jgi:hypothetical protein
VYVWFYWAVTVFRNWMMWMMMVMMIGAGRLQPSIDTLLADDRECSALAAT